MPIALPELSPEETLEFYRLRVIRNAALYGKMGRLATRLGLAFSLLEFVFRSPNWPAALVVRLGVGGLIFAHLRLIDKETDELKFDRDIVRHATIVALLGCAAWSRLPSAYLVAMPPPSQILIFSALVMARSDRIWWLLPCVGFVEVGLWWIGLSPTVLAVHTMTMLMGIAIGWVGARGLEASRRREYLLEKKLKLEASTDTLTGLSNRRVLHRTLNAELQRSLRYKQGLSVLMIDIDHFKAINDSYGHTAGDEALQLLSSFLAKSVRATDTVGRWGGEEFLVVLPETPADQARGLAERLRSGCERLSSGLLHFTISCGLATLQPGQDWETLVKQADAAMYQAKRSGRNRVCVSV